MRTEDTILVGFNAAYGEDGAFIAVGRKNPGMGVTILNTISGKEAVDIYKKLIGEKEKTDALS
jgi:hypothetical protein